MGKVIKVSSFEEMTNTAKYLKEMSAKYTELYTQLMQDATTMGQAWEGADNIAFVEQIKGVTTELENMAKKLEVAGDALNIQAENYKGIQDVNIQQVKKLAN